MVKPWYKQFWPWFLIILPLTVVIWTVVTVIVFANNSVSLVTEDYYKKAKALILILLKSMSPKSWDWTLPFTLKVARSSLNSTKVNLLTSLLFKPCCSSHTAWSRFSQLITADAKGIYRLNLENELQGPWFIELTPHDGQWLVQGRVTFPSSPTALMN